MPLTFATHQFEVYKLKFEIKLSLETEFIKTTHIFTSTQFANCQHDKLR